MGFGRVTNNLVIISGEEQRDSATHIHVPNLPQTCLPSRLPYNIEQSSISYTVDPFKYSSVYMSIPNSLTTYPFPPILPPGNHTEESFCIHIYRNREVK